MTSKTRFRCGKCGQIYFDEENLGTLQCIDTYYTIDGNHSFKIKADHRPIMGRKQASALDWQDWVWSIDDYVPIEVNLLKKKVPQPNKLSIIDLDKFNMMNEEYMEGFIKDDIKTEKMTTHVVLVGDKTSTLDDDSLFGYGYDSYDDDLIQEETKDDIHGYENMCMSEGIIKEVWVARFDWREKFRILLRIKKIDNEIQMHESRSVKSVPYYETLEYANNPHLRRQYLDHISLNLD